MSGEGGTNYISWRQIIKLSMHVKNISKQSMRFI